MLAKGAALKDPRRLCPPSRSESTRMLVRHAFLFAASARIAHAEIGLARSGGGDAADVEAFDKEREGQWAAFEHDDATLSLDRDQLPWWLWASGDG